MLLNYDNKLIEKEGLALVVPEGERCRNRVAAARARLF